MRIGSVGGAFLCGPPPAAEIKKILETQKLKLVKRHIDEHYETRLTWFHFQAGELSWLDESVRRVCFLW